MTFQKRTNISALSDLHFRGRALDLPELLKGSYMEEKSRQGKAGTAETLQLEILTDPRKQKRPFHHPMVPQISGKDTRATGKYSCVLFQCNYTARYFSAFILSQRKEKHPSYLFPLK